MNDKINKILEMQSNGIDIKEIASELNYKSVKPLRDYMGKKGYRCQEGKFIPKEANQNTVENEKSTSLNNDNSIIDNVENKPVEEDPMGKETAKVKKNKSVSNNEIKATLDDMKEEMKKELERIKYYMLNEAYKTRFELPIKTSDKTNPTSIRFYKDDKEAFDNLCKTKFKDINKDALHSMAIREFVEKYGD